MDRRACTKHMTQVHVHVHVSACANKHDRHIIHVHVWNAAELDASSGVLGNRLFTPAALCAPDG